MVASYAGLNLPPHDLRKELEEMLQKKNQAGTLDLLTRLLKMYPDNREYLALYEQLTKKGE